MKKILLAVITSVGFVNAAEFVSPITFDGSEEQKKTVIEYIEQRVAKSSKAIGTDTATFKRMMEDAHLTSFKKLTKADDKAALKNIISKYCGSMIDMCDYATIEIMYDQEIKSKKTKLEW